MLFVYSKSSLTLEALGGGSKIDHPTPRLIFLALNFCSLSDCQKLQYNCSLFVNTSFDTNKNLLIGVTSDDVIVKSHTIYVLTAKSQFLLETY